MPVVQLKVPQAWRVGRVTFRAPGWLASHANLNATDSDLATVQFLEWAREGIEGHSASTAEVRVRWPEKETQPTIDAAVENVRDSIAVLLLYQHARYPTLNRDVQQFGVHGDVGATAWRFTVTDGGRVLVAGHHWLGIIGDWEFSRDDVRAYRTDPRFAYLDRALRTPPLRRTELQRRALMAVRSCSLATPMLREQLRVVLLATALEALLSAELSPGGRHERGEFFRIAQRASYLICGEPDHRYPSRPPCPYLHAKSERALTKALEDRAKRGEQPVCSAFWHVFDLLQDRNDALHSARERFGHRRVSWHAISTEQVILYALGWASVTGAKALSELQAEFDGFVRGGTAVLP
jgi:hypothetical protein